MSSQLHLLPDADEILAEQMPGYSWAFAFTAAGVILVLAIEQSVFVLSSSISENQSDIKGIELESSKAYQGEHDEECGVTKCSHTVASTPTQYLDHDHSHSHSHSHESTLTQRPVMHNHCASSAPHAGCQDGEHDHAAEEAVILQNVLNSVGLRAMITAYVMEISIAVHSIIIGVDLGLLGHSDEVPTLVSLIIALSFHQFIEGVGLGSTIQASKASLGNSKIMGFVAIFSLTMPIGILIGILTSSDSESRGQLIGKGVANSFAAGSLLYISLTEMVGSYFHAHALAHQPMVKLTMVASFAFGAIIMAVIAIWA